MDKGDVHNVQEQEKDPSAEMYVSTRSCPGLTCEGVLVPSFLRRFLCKFPGNNEIVCSAYGILVLSLLSQS